MVTVPYAIEVTGDDTAVKKLESVDRVVHSMANNVSSRFKQVAGDVGIVGDRLGSKMGETFARAASDATGLIETLSSGGLGLAIAGVTAAVAGLEWAWRKMQEEADRGITATFDALKNQDDAIKELSKRIQGENRKATEDDKAAAAARLSAAVITYGKLVNSEEEFQKDLTEKKRAGAITYEQFEQAKADRINAINLALTRRNQAQQELEAIQQKLNTQKTVDAAEKAEREKEAAAKKAEAERTAAQKREAAERIRVEEKEAEERMKIIRQEIAAKSSSTLEALQMGLDELDEAIAYGDSDLAKIDEEDRRRRAKELAEDVDRQLKEQREANDKVAESEKKKREEIERTNAALRKQQTEVMGAIGTNAAFAASNAAFAFGLDVASQSIDFATQQLQKFGEINRDNARELLEFTPKAIEAFAKQAQAALWNMALQAGKKAIFENAESIKESALALGAFAMGNVPSGAMHAASAVQHAASSAAYGALAGGAGIASLGIGAIRGSDKGALIGLGEDEKEKQKGGGSVGGGPSAGRIGRRNEIAPVQVVFNYGVAVLDSRDEQRTANTVAMGVRRANRDGFARKAMEA